MPDWFKAIPDHRAIHTPPGSRVWWNGKTHQVNDTRDEPGPPCLTAVHAELNALMFAARYGVATEGAEIHTTHQPCLNCAMAIVNGGVVRVMYEHPYRDNGGLDLLIAAGVTAEKLIR